MKTNTIAEVADMLGRPAQVVKWIEQQDVESQISNANDIFHLLLEQATQSRSVPGSAGSACMRLCGFVDQSCKAQSEDLRVWATSESTLLRLFEFHVEWNESDSRRATKLLLELITQLIRRNSDDKNHLPTRKVLLDSLVSIVAGRSTKPVVKSAIKTLDHFLSKRLFTLDDLKSSYVRHRHEAGQLADIEIWHLFFTDLFHWMQFSLICPTAGRLMVCLYCLLRQAEQELSPGLSMDIWHTWLLGFLAEEPALLETFKNYIFLPIFTLDRVEALRFLRRMNNDQIASHSGALDVDLRTLLQLAALETGKKVGLVEDSDLSSQQSTDEQNEPLLLNEKVYKGVLAHPSPEVRSLALSLLITSPSTTRPFSSTTLDLLRKHLPTVFADADTKFRVETSAKVRDMFRRIRGSMFVLKRSIPRAQAEARKKSEAQATDSLTTAPQPVVYRSNLITLPELQLVRCLDDHEKFLRWYIGFLRKEVTPVASYQRHITSIRALTSILRLEADASKSWETPDDQQLFYDLFDGKWVRALFDLVMDPFDDIRGISAVALKSLFSDARYRKFVMDDERGDNSPAANVSELLRRADELALRTARADHSDGVARICQLVYRFLPAEKSRLTFLSKLINELDRKISAAEKDLGRAVLQAPLHSDFASLCFTWQVVAEIEFSSSEIEAVQSLQSRLVNLCERVWSAVRGILCDDSPEGHLPQELEEVDGLDTKDVLSYSFRAIHESSNLMRIMVLTNKNRTRDDSISPSPNDFERMGNLTFDQLSSLRHRGAFTTVSLTFATCCQQTKFLEPVDNDEPLLDVWYKGAMQAIFAQASTTRRSAGIPSLMTGILSANASQPSFSQVMEKLLDIARLEVRATETDGTKLPQVHAYNCLKDIFKSSILTSMGNQSEKYLPECLELAASGLKSDVWAIRNCGLIFLRSLIDCLFGSQETRAMIESGWDGKANRIPYHRYPNLPKVLVNLLKSGHQMITETASVSSAAESVFPALDIIRRAGPPEMFRDEIQVHISRYLASPVWHVREIAARTLCSCLLHEKWLLTTQGILTEALSDSTTSLKNHVHGGLMTLRFVFERLSEVAPDRLIEDLPQLTMFLTQCDINKVFSDCQDIVAAYLQVVNMIWAVQRSRSQALESLDVSAPANIGTALLKTQKITSDIYVVSQENEPVEKLRNLLLEGHVGVNGLITALEMMATLWHDPSTSDSILSSLGQLYIDICLKAGLVEVQAVAIQNLAEVLDQLLFDEKFDKISSLSLRQLWTGLPARSMNPGLSNAIIRVSGCIMAIFRRSNEVTSVGLRNWGLMMADAGLDYQTFDTRFAAIESLRSFFAVDGTYSSEEYLPALVALYDTLNDDDDEIRIVGPAAANSILSLALTPLEAANNLLGWLSQHFNGSPAFRFIVASRLAGADGTVTADAPWEPASSQLSKAMRFDDSLFAVEEKNLFIDEVRETKRWIAVFEALEWETRDETLARLDAWARDGLDQMLQLADQEDGPLGWASRPQVFAICSRVIHCSVALGKRLGSQELRESVDKVKSKLSTHGKRVSGLLMESFEEEV